MQLWDVHDFEPPSDVHWDGLSSSEERNIEDASKDKLILTMYSNLYVSSNMRRLGPYAFLFERNRVGRTGNRQNLTTLAHASFSCPIIIRAKPPRPHLSGIWRFRLMIDGIKKELGAIVVGTELSVVVSSMFVGDMGVWRGGCHEGAKIHIELLLCAVPCCVGHNGCGYAYQSV